MPRTTRHSLRCGLALLFMGAMSAAMAHNGHEHADAADPLSAEAPFVSENNAAMDRMMAGMDVKPSGDVDHDFVAMMTAHHQGAIDMAQTVIDDGADPDVRTLAEAIIAAQSAEITEMQNLDLE